ncbi:MAG: hypothetical protein M1354_00490 [Candidatus Marsarchaeota archaeon]|nr:hypothetical protein [Candidatus Marsarchaeota archaeon]
MPSISVNKPGRVAVADSERRQQSDTFETDVLKNVIRENWRDDVKTREAVRELLFSLDEHATNMRKMFGAYDYEIFGMPVIVSNTVHMKPEEARQYLAHLEAIATGYRNLLGGDIANLIMIGLPRKAKDLRGASRYTTLLVKELERRHFAYRKRMTRESMALDGLARKLAESNSGILRFFRHGRIMRLKDRKSRRLSRMAKLETGMSRYLYLLDMVREKTAPADQRR